MTSRSSQSPPIKAMHRAARKAEDPSLFGALRPGAYLAIDCEMVGTGPDGSESALARVSIVNYHGHIVLDTFVRPRERVTDWRTWVSGVSEEDMWDAVSFEEVQKTVGKLVEGKILVGHAVEHDTKVSYLATNCDDL